jgi:hypothetical protein
MSGERIAISKAKDTGRAVAGPREAAEPGLDRVEAAPIGVPRAPIARRLTPASVVGLQRSIGNQATQRFISRAAPGASKLLGAVQRALKVSDADDSSEQEAERVAMGSGFGRVSAGPPRAQRQQDAVTPAISGSGEVDSGVESRIDSARGGGEAIEDTVRRPMEQSFGADFRGVRVHADPVAAGLSQDLGARAFTTRSDIFFAGGAYNPSSGDGQKLLAHELTHVVQQSGGGASAGPGGRIQAVPTVTAVIAPADVGVGGSIKVNATVAAGKPPITWSLVAPPAGVSITPSGINATITASAASKAAAGATFKVQAALTKTPGDLAVSANINLVGVTAVTFVATPAFATPVLPLGWAAPFPPGTADPNRDGLAGNTAVATVVTAPAGRATTLTLKTALGATAAGTTLTPGSATGDIKVRATDDLTKTGLDAKLPVNPVPTRLSAFTAQAGAGAPGVTYGAKNTIAWARSDATANPLPPRVIGETITAGGSDDFKYTASVNGGPNPAPTLNLAVPSDKWSDQLFTGVGPAAGAAGDTNPINVNAFVGPGVAKKLPGVWVLRQGFHYLSWTGGWSTEFDNGTHRRSLIQAGKAFKFTTEHIFPGASAKLFAEPYAGPPLIVLSGITSTPSVPAAVGVAADGVAQGDVTVATTVPGRNVNWSVTSGPISITGSGIAVGAKATLQAGMVAGKFPVKVFDTVFPNRFGEGKVTISPVKVGGMVAPVSKVPAGTLLAVVNANADPGGRTVNWTVDAAAAAAGVTVVGAVPGGANLPGRTANVTRPAAFKGKVTVTATDSVLPAKKNSISITFK